LLLFRTLLQEHPYICGLPGLKKTRSSYSDHSGEHNDGFVCFGRVIDAIFHMFSVEQRCSVELRDVGLSVLHQASFVVGCAMHHLRNSRLHSTTSYSSSMALHAHFIAQCSERWTTMFVHLLSLLSSSRTEALHYTRSLLNTLSVMLRLRHPSGEMLMDSEQTHSDKSQRLLWSLPCFRHHQKPSLDEASANLAMLVHQVTTEHNRVCVWMTVQSRHYSLQSFR
jgi:hypothetical protein